MPGQLERDGHGGGHGGGQRGGPGPGLPGPVRGVVRVVLRYRGLADGAHRAARQPGVARGRDEAGQEAALPRTRGRDRGDRSAAGVAQIE